MPAFAGRPVHPDPCLKPGQGRIQDSEGGWGDGLYICLYLQGNDVWTGLKIS